MSDIRLFRLNTDSVEPIVGSAAALERSLQTLIEKHAEALLGVRFLASEYSTTKSQSGRIDTLGIDESGSPVIIEYKRAVNENVINQGLYYLNWLLDHQADFTWLVLKGLGAAAVETIEWGSPRLICIASDFTKYDQHAIHQMPGNIDLVRYRRYGDDLLLLEQFASSAVEPSVHKLRKSATDGKSAVSAGSPAGPNVAQTKSLAQLKQCSAEVQDWYDALRAHALSLGDGVYKHAIDSYISFRALKNFAYIRFSSKLNKIVMSLKLDHATVTEDAGFIRSIPSQWPTIEIDSAEDVERALPLIAKSYQNT